MKIGIYIDGFNLYYGLFRHGPPECKQYKWLNPVLMGQELAFRLKLGGEVSRVRYFTAPSKRNPDDPGQSTRQQMLVRAMETCPEVSIHWGQHIDTIKHGYLIDDESKAIQRFSTREEKGSDVSLGVYLVRDAALNDVDVAILVSNDSDLADAVSVAVQDMGTPVYVASPQPRRHISRKLQERASGVLVIDASCLAGCQFPNPVIDRKGRQIHKPEAWKYPEAGSSDEES